MQRGPADNSFSKFSFLTKNGSLIACAWNQRCPKMAHFHQLKSSFFNDILHRMITYVVSTKPNDAIGAIVFPLCVF